MAHRKRRRKVRASSAPRRRRRRHLRANPPHMRHRRRSRRRHSFRRNPPGGLVFGSIVQGAKDGAAVVVGQVVNGKIVGAAQGAFSSVAALQQPLGKVALNVGAAIMTSIVARKAAPGAYARFIAAGAFSEAINCALAQTPIASYLGARRPVFVRTGVPGNGMGAIGPVSRPGVGAYTRGAGMGAYTQARVPVATHVGSN